MTKTITITSKFLAYRKTLWLSDCGDYVTNGIFILRVDCLTPGWQKYLDDSYTRTIGHLESALGADVVYCTMAPIVCRQDGYAWRLGVKNCGERFVINDDLATALEKKNFCFGGTDKEDAIQIVCQERGVVGLLMPGTRDALKTVLGRLAHYLKD